MLPVLIFVAYFALMAGLIGYICWTGRPAEVEPWAGLPAAEMESREPGGDEPPLAA